MFFGDNIAVVQVIVCHSEQREESRNVFCYVPARDPSDTAFCQDDIIVDC